MTALDELEVARWRLDQAHRLLEDYYKVFFDPNQTPEQKSMAAIYTCGAVYTTLCLTADQVQKEREKGEEMTTRFRA